MDALPRTSNLNTFRNRFAVWLANKVLLIASRKYRTFIKGAIMLGVEKATEMVESDTI